MSESKVLKASEVLALANSNENTNEKSITVTRPLDQENDLGNLLGSEVNELDLMGDNLEDKLKSIGKLLCKTIKLLKYSR